MARKGLTTREEDYARWYLEVIAAADMAEHAPVKGCMIIKPWGYGIWERMQRALDDMIKETGHENAYFQGYPGRRRLRQRPQDKPGRSAL